MDTSNATANTATSQHAFVVNQISENLYCNLVCEIGHSFSPDVSEEDFNSAFLQAALTFAANVLVSERDRCDTEDALCLLRKMVEAIIAEERAIAEKSAEIDFT